MMKIRSLELNNFRKFTGTVRVGGIGDGLNVLVGPNEYGKSTLLAALNGVIFEKATSQGEEVKGFRHFVNGAVPTVDLGLEIDGVLWTLHKRFSGQSGRTVLSDKSGRRFEAEGAEAELQRLIGFERPFRKAEPGIWGTLWVQQGKAIGGPDLDPSSRHSLERCLEAQIGIVTGGHRGHRIPGAIEAELRQIKSARGPSGEFRKAIDQLAHAREEAQNLASKREQVLAQMGELARLRRERQRMLSAWDEAAHQSELDGLRVRQTEAAKKAAEIAAASSAQTLAAAQAEQARKEEAARSALIAETERLQREVKEAEVGFTRADEARTEIQSRVGQGERELTELRALERSNAAQVRRLDRLRHALVIAQEIAEHRETVSWAEGLRSDVSRLLVAIGANSATGEGVSRAEDLFGEVEGARAAVNAVATTVKFALDPAALARVRLDGVPLGGPAVSVSAVSSKTIAIDDIGEITVEPQVADQDRILDRLRRAEAEYADALDAIGATDLPAARRLAAARRELTSQLEAKRREIRASAPAEPARNMRAGLEARETRISELQGELATECERLDMAELPPAADVQQELSIAHREGEQFEGRIDEAVAALYGPKQALVEAEQDVGKLRDGLTKLNADYENRCGRLAAGRAISSDEDLAARVVGKQRLADTAREAREALERERGETADDIAIRIKRLEAAGQGHVEHVARLNNSISRLQGEIEAVEANGIEETLGTKQAEVERLQRAVANYVEDVAVLELLRETLWAAESEAKQRYLAPVVERTTPYLRMLLPGAPQLKFGENLGIEAIERSSSGAEAFSYLSVGTQEQLAVLTRLAFAELLLDQGRPATVILDDALVFSDDERIERMFDILMRASDKVQIIVLTCRQRLFTRLGAEVLRIVHVADAA